MCLGSDGNNQLILASPHFFKNAFYEFYTRKNFLDPACLIQLKCNTSCGSRVFHLDSVQLYVVYRMISFPSFRRQKVN